MRKEKRSSERQRIFLCGEGRSRAVMRLEDNQAVVLKFERSREACPRSQVLSLCGVLPGLSKKLTQKPSVYKDVEYVNVFR